MTGTRPLHLFTPDVGHAHEALEQGVHQVLAVLRLEGDALQHGVQAPEPLDLWALSTADRRQEAERQ